jgi:hypothetical protein
LDLFHLGNLKSVHLFSLKKTDAMRAELQAEDDLQHHYAEIGLKTK